MITEKELKKLLHKEKLTDIEMISVIKKYIYDRKGVDIGDVERPRGEICPSVLNKINPLKIAENQMYLTDVYLMFEMYVCALKWYSENEK